MTMNEFMKSRWGIALGEPSTWRAIIMLFGAFGYQLTDDQADHTVATILELVGLFGLFFKDNVESKTIKDLVRESREK